MYGLFTPGKDKYKYMKYKVFLLNKNGITRFPINNLWASAKTYHEENSKSADQWEWGTPHIDYSDYNKLLALLVRENPTIIGFSVYMWNELFVQQLAAELKQQLPNTIIIFGGPQSDAKYNKDYFKIHSYLDLVVPGDAYGETAISAILDNIVENNGYLDASVIGYSYWPAYDRTSNFNPIGPKKTEYKWPKNPFRAQEKYLKPILESLENPEALWLSVESSRGCPYKCSFCDWGGGTYTKTVKKDFSTVLDELTWAGENKIHGMWITDANFGIFDIDIEYAKHLVRIAEKYGYPKVVQIQPSKTKLKNLREIFQILAEADLIRFYQISVQDLDEQVKKNVDRVDFAFDVQVEMFRELQKIKYLPIQIETIMGLPGSTIATNKASIQHISLHKLIMPIGYHWSLLPETPAYAPEYREKWKLITVTHKASTGTGSGHSVKLKPNRIGDPGVNGAIDDGMDITTEFVIGTSSYTTDDWIEMNMLQIFTAATQITKLLDLVGDYLWTEHQIEYGEFFHQAINTLLYDETVDNELKNKFLILRTTFDSWINGGTGDADVYCDIHEDLPFTVAPAVYCVYTALSNIDNFFDAILIAISKLVPIDDKIIDLCHYSKNRVFDIDYHPGKIFAFLDRLPLRKISFDFS